MFTEKIIGPPGTGKTAALIERVKAELAAGVAPEKIGYYSFTRAAARVAQQRVMDAFPEYSRENFPHFRTLHSEAFKQLSWTREKVMAGKNLHAFAMAKGYPISQLFQFPEDLEDHEVREVLLKTQGDFMLFFTNWRTNLLLDFDAAYVEFWKLCGDSWPDGWFPATVRQFEERYREYKAENGLLDFNDMLTRVMAEDSPPPLDVLVFDEAQDSSPLQYKVLDNWLRGVKRHYIAGDPDQCIYQWMGTAPEIFMARHCDKLTTLAQSFRVPQAVHQLATGILTPTAEYRPRPAPGEVSELSNEAVLDRLRSLNGHTAFSLVRNLYLLRYRVEELIQWGIPFENFRGASPFKGKASARILTIRKLFRGESIPAEDLWSLVQDIPQKPNFIRGFKAETQTLAKEQPQLPCRLEGVRGFCTERFLADPVGALDLSPDYNAYFARVIERYGEAVLLKRPLVTIGTIHSVKGMEADYVVIAPDMSRKTWLWGQRVSEEEKRVWYVAVTRAREGVLQTPAWGEYFWEWPKQGDGQR